MKLYLAEISVQRSEYIGAGQERQYDAAIKYTRIVTANSDWEARHAIRQRFERYDKYGEGFEVVHMAVHEAISLDVQNQ